MIINHELAQKLVDHIMENLGYNINIMNEEGVIIASGSNLRIGSYHTIAKEVIQKNKRIDINKEDESKYKGVKQGINIPFYYNQSIAGVIGITGDPKELENTAELVRLSTELMLEQQALKERVYSYQNQKNFFINTLLSLDSDEDVMTATQWGMKLGYDLHQPRIICILSIRQMNHYLKENPLMTVEMLKQDILRTIQRTCFFTKQDLLSLINIDECILFKLYNPDDEDSINVIKEQLIDLSQRLCEQFEIELIIGVGSYHATLYGFKKSYKEAKAMIHYGQLMNRVNQPIYVGDHIFEFLLTTMDRELLEHFLSSTVDKIKDNSNTIETMEALINNNMSVIEASKALYVHRNTLIFRLNKIKEMLHIDPLHKETDRLHFHLIYLYYKYFSAPT